VNSEFKYDAFTSPDKDSRQDAIRLRRTLRIRWIIKKPRRVKGRGF
jgi:hypothetical protein